MQRIGNVLKKYIVSNAHKIYMSSASTFQVQLHSEFFIDVRNSDKIKFSSGYYELSNSVLFDGC